MNDQLQQAINLLHAMGHDASAKAVEELRGALTKAIDSLHAAQRDAYAAGRKDERELIEFASGPLSDCA